MMYNYNMMVFDKYDQGCAVIGTVSAEDRAMAIARSEVDSLVTACKKLSCSHEDIKDMYILSIEQVHDPADNEYAGVDEVIATYERGDNPFIDGFIFGDVTEG